MKKASQMETTRTERISYAMKSFSGSLMSTLPSYYLLFFYTDILKLSVGSISLLVLTSKIWDGINDQILAHFMSNTKTRFGRFRPYILWSCVPASLFFALMFYSPDMSDIYKLIYAYITYYIWDLFSSVISITTNSLLPMMSKYRGERTLLNSYRVTASVIAALIVSSFALQMVGFFGGGSQKTGFAATALMIGLIAAPMQLFSFKYIKERHDVPQEGRISVRKALKCIFTDKRLVTAFIIFFTFWMATAFKNQTTTYYMKYVLLMPERIGDFFFIGSISSLGAQVLIKKLTDKIRVEIAMAVGILGSMAGILIMAAAGQNLIILYAGNIFWGVTSAFPANLIYVLMADFVDKLIQKYRMNLSSWVYSIIRFLSKIGDGISGAFCSLVLYLTGYVADSPVSAEGLAGIKFNFLGATIIALAVSLLSMLIFIGPKKRVQYIRSA